MALLTLIKGHDEGAKYRLDAPETVLGREADCNVVINVPAVSRRHAQISQVDGEFFIQDLQSRNGTYLNDAKVEEKNPVALKNNDQIKICDNIFVFRDVPEKPPLPKDWLPADLIVEEEDGGSSTVEATLNQSSKQILQTQPAEKLAFLLEVTAELTGTFDLDEILPQIISSLFQVFKQADRAFVIMGEGEGDNLKLIPKIVHKRHGQDDDATARFSRKIVRTCMEESKALLSEDASSDSRFDLSQSIADCRIRSVMVAPLKSRNNEKPLGVLQLDTQDRSKKFTEDDLKLLMAVAGQAAIALENAEMHQTIVRRAGLERDLKLAHQVQLSFLPKAPPKVAGYEYFAYYASAQEVGGDYYDFIPLPGGRMAVMLGDVAGKGVPAALLMAKVSSDARFAMLTEPGPAQAIRRLNDLLQEAGMLDRFVTLEAAVVDTQQHQVTFVSAGHNPAVIYQHETGQVTEAFSHEVGGLPLGIAPGFPYEVCTTMPLNPGDTVLMFSDGVTEAPNRTGQEFGLPGIMQAVSAGPTNPAALVPRLAAAVSEHSRGCVQHDDITAVCFGRIIS